METEFKKTLWILAIIGGITFLICSLSVVPYNYYAYEKEFGTLKSELKETGINYIGLGQLVKVNNQVRTYNIHVAAASNSMQDVNFDVNLQIRLLKDKSYDFIKDYADEQTYITYMNNKIQEKSKTVIYKYSPKEILDNRLTISHEIRTEVQSMPELKYFEIQDVALANIDFGTKYKEVIEMNAKLDIEKEMLIKQKTNLELQQKNINSIDVDKYFKYQLIEKWDGQSSLFLSDNILFSK